MFGFQFTLNFHSPFLAALLTFLFFYIVLWMPACLYLLEIFFWKKLHWPTLYDRELAYLLVNALMWTLNSTFYVDPCTDIQKCIHTRILSFHKKITTQSPDELTINTLFFLYFTDIFKAVGLRVHAGSTTSSLLPCCSVF